MRTKPPTRKNSRSCLQRLVRNWKREAIQLRREVAETNLRYYDLLIAVARKFDGETRHETAIRYIREAEDRAVNGAVYSSPNNQAEP